MWDQLEGEARKVVEALSTHSNVEGLETVIAGLSRILSDLGLSRQLLDDVSKIVADLSGG